MLKRLLPYVTLFSSLGTLVCCAIPALLVTLGLGASLAAFLGNYPQLIWLSEHKIAVFVFAGLMLTASAVMRWRAAAESCPVDPNLARACQSTKRISTALFWGSLLIYAIGAFFAFIAPLIWE